MLICWVTSITLGVQVLKANILQISPELEEAARIVGAPQGRTFRDIVIPLALPRNRRRGRHGFPAFSAPRAFAAR